MGLTLAQAFRLPEAPCLALTGAGGKTAALFQLARQLSPPVLVTTSTHLALEQLPSADVHLTLERPGQAAALQAHWPQGAVVLLTGPPAAEGRVSGLAPETLAELLHLAEAGPSGSPVPLLIEADGARRLPLKAPGEHEPAVPGWVDAVVVVAGLSGLGRPLSGEWVHRPELFSALAGLEPGEVISVEALARVLEHPQGGLKNIPAGARRLLLLNQADTAERQAQARRLALRLQAVYPTIVVASLAPASGPAVIHAVHVPVAGILLAAGAASRFGQAKGALLWRGEPLARHAARAALEAGLSPLVVVTGAHADSLQSALSGLPVRLVHNPNWETGQSSSLQAGLKALPAETGAAVFLLADQPLVPAGLVRALVDAHASSLAPVVAPLVDGRRSNPVLFNRAVFTELMELRGDTGGRPLFARHRVEWVPWHDPRLLLDIDTPEDYQKLLEIE